jgi:hypothetical protein
LGKASEELQKSALLAIAHHEFGTKTALTALITAVIEKSPKTNFLSLPII